MTDNNLTGRALAHKIALLAQEQGGAVYFVGGCVRDRLLGRPCKDTDIELHGIAKPAAEALLARLGPVKKMGRGFEIYSFPGSSLDISLPRERRATPEEAAARRDFTMNALMEDALTGEILDFFGGREDLSRGIIRHIPGSLEADPLRVLRAARFAAALGFDIAPETISAARTVSLEAIAPERIMGELSLALATDKPSRFFECLRETDAMDLWFPELAALAGTPQNPAHHEGDVWLHTMKVLDKAAACRDEASDSLGFMLAALCHDTGKPAATVIDPDGRVHAPRHPKKGAEAAKRFLRRITTKKSLIKYVSNMVLLHMLPNRFAARESESDFMHMLEKALVPRDLLLLARYDLESTLLRKDESLWEWQLKLLERYNTLEPYVTGRDLMELGVGPGPALGKALKKCRSMQLDGASREEALAKAVKKYKGTP